MTWLPAVDTLLELALRSSLIVAVAASIALALRRSSPVLRHAVWTVAVVVLLALPLSSGLAPAIGAGMLDLHVAPSPTVAIDTTPQLSTAATPDANASPRPNPRERADAPGGLTASDTSRGMPGAGVVLPLLWLAGAAFVMIFMLLQWGGVAWTLRRRRAFDGADVDTGGVPIYTSDRARVPFVWGAFRPFIVLPADGAGWSAARLRAVLLHELAHVRRRDVLTRSLGCVAAAIFWFNPLVWFALSRLESESEAACDDAVVASGVSATDYARHLLAVAESMSRRVGVVGAVGMARRLPVEKRLRRLLDPRRAGRGASLLARMVAVVLLVGLSIPVATVRIVATPTVQVEASPDGMSPAEYAAQELRKIGTRGADALARAIETRDWPARKAEDVSRPLDTRAVKPLLVSLEDDDAVVRRLSAWGLGEAGDPRAVDGLRRALDDDVAAVRAQAAQSLGDIGSDDATRDLLAALRDDDAEVRERAAHALGDILDSRAVDGLTRALDDDDAGVRHRADWALRQIDERSVENDVFAAIRSDNASRRVMAAHEMGDRRSDDAVPELVTALGDRDARVREKAAWALGEIRSPEATKMLITIATNEDEDIDVRRQAIRALGETGDDTAVPALVGLLSHDDKRLRSQAADALGDIGDARALEPLKGIYRSDSSRMVRENADKAIGKIVRGQR